MWRVCVCGPAIQKPEEKLSVGSCLLTHLRWVLLLLISVYALLVSLWTCRDCLYLHLMVTTLGWQVYVEIYMALEVLSSGLHTCPASVLATAPPFSCIVMQLYTLYLWSFPFVDLIANHNDESRLDPLFLLLHNNLLFQLIIFLSCKFSWWTHTIFLIFHFYNVAVNKYEHNPL